MFGSDANGKIRTDNAQLYEVLPKTFAMFNKLHGKEAAEALELFATNVLVNESIPNDGYFTKIEDEPFPTVEVLKSLYIEYGGDEYCLWHDYGDAYIDACKKFQISQKDKEMWVNNQMN